MWSYQKSLKVMNNHIHADSVAYKFMDWWDQTKLKWRPGHARPTTWQ